MVALLEVIFRLDDIIIISNRMSENENNNNNSNYNSYEAEERRLMADIRETLEYLKANISNKKSFIDIFLTFMQELRNLGHLDYIPEDVEKGVSIIANDLLGKIVNSSDRSTVQEAYSQFEEALEYFKEEERESLAKLPNPTEFEQYLEEMDAIEEKRVKLEANKKARLNAKALKNSIPELPYEVRNPMGAKLGEEVKATKPKGKFWNKSNNSSNNERRSRNRKQNNRKRTRRNTCK